MLNIDISKNNHPNLSDIDIENIIKKKEICERVNDM